ncbi:acyl-CoA synthetase [Bradyrhizobium sp. BR 10261]|uniref:acyl-CoA synthetase n=1 Tax=Bradyrhizobium sp. BR 10261 TaxID=2749992 RepID=UPI001C650ABA|nr:acyl-CoA synthetase [Bradyrhizobium sp. BR 10261]MBW7964894.1 acyl-CoA synthetase [Bradyrhizobium sp. BR 10261]
MPVRDLADIQRIEAEHLATRRLPQTTYEVFRAGAQRWPDRKALTFFLSADDYQRASTWSYAELLAEITRAANAFQAFGVDADHPVAYVLPNLPETHFTIWGGEAAGVVLAVNPLLEPDLVVEILRAAKVRVLVTLAPAAGAELWSKLSPRLSTLSELRVVALVDAMTYREGGVGASMAAAVSGLPNADFKVVDFRAAMLAQPADRLVVPRTITEHSVSSYFCTGGTTGAPKIAVRTHGNEVFDAWAAAQVFGAFEEPRTYFCGLPLFHVNAQLVTGLLPWMQGQHVLLATPEGYRSKNLIARFWEIAAHYRIATFSGVPTVYAALLEVPVGDNDVSSLEYAICGAAPMPAKLIESFEAKTGLKIVEGYGLTEGTCVSCLNPPEGKRLAGSIGLRLPYQQMRVVVLDDAGSFVRMADVDEIGTIAISGPNVFVGYLDPQQNKDLWIDIEGRRWLNTGDLGRQDDRGYFWLAGRRKELIIRGGHNIDPKLIEDALSKHPAIAMTAAVGSPDPYAGEVPVAYVQLKPGAAVEVDELMDFAAAHVPERAAIPKHVKIMPSLPVTGIGKVFKPALQQREIEAAVRGEAQNAGATIIGMALESSPRVGKVMRVRAGAGAAALRARLERYAFKFEVVDW